MLSPVEDFWLRWHVEHSDIEIAEKARVVLEAESGGAPGQMAASLGLSSQTVERLLAKFEHDRLAAFPRPTLKLTQLIQIDSVDASGREHVARLAKQLFNQTRPLHHLPRQSRHLLEAAAWLVSMTGSVPGNGTAQRNLDLLDGATLADYSANEQAIITSVLQLQRQGYRADRDPVFRRLRPTDQSRVRHLAALLQVALALNHSKTQSTVLDAADLETEAVVMRLVGPKADSDAHYACRHARLWQPVFHLALQYTVGPRRKAAEAKRQAVMAPRRGEPVGDVFGREVMAALRKWPATLPGTEHPDGASLADLLAGVTEAEAALEAFASVLKRQPVKQVRRPLRALTKRLYIAAAHLNALADLRAYCSGRPPAVVTELQPLCDAWERSSRREEAAVRAWQKSQDAAELQAQLADLAASAPIRRRKATSIRAAAPVLLDELYAEVAECEAAVVADRPKTYWRYQRSLAHLACALRSLRSTIGDKAGTVAELELLLADMQRLYGHIGRWLDSNALNDAIATFLDTWAEQQARRKAPQLFGAQAILAYRQARRAQWSRLRNGLPANWRPVQAKRLRRRLEKLLKQLEHS